MMKLFSAMSVKVQTGLKINPEKRKEKGGGAKVDDHIFYLVSLSLSLSISLSLSLSLSLSGT